MIRHATRRLLALSLLPALAAVLAVGPALALTLPQGAEILADDPAALGEVLVARDRWTAAKGLPADRITGMVRVQSWRLDDGGMSTHALLSVLRSQLEKDGFLTGFSCHSDDCGGFDFRFSIPTLPEPRMHVDLGDYRYLVARRAGALGPEYTLVLVSRGPGTLYAQITQILPETAPRIALQAAPAAAKAAEPDLPASGPATDTSSAVVASLLDQGHAALDDLAFATGDADLLDREYGSLKELGTWLLANPANTVVLVGHTDASGGLAGNVALSQRRAEAVRAWLMEHFELSADRIGAEGVGYLAPRASNLTDEGRAQNRRVEVMLTPTR